MFESDRLWNELYYDTILQGRRGAVLRALSTVDIAIWDLEGKLVGLPLAHLLGVCQDPVPAYASGGYYFDDRDPVAEIEEEVAVWAEAGYTAMKLKVGGAPLEVDLKRLKAFRNVVGDGPKLMLDANNAWRDWRTALRAIRRMEGFDLEWIEEPLPPDDVEGHRRLAEVLNLAVATGEIEATRWGFAQLLRERAEDVIQVDAAVAGGDGEWKRIADPAASFDVPEAPHWLSALHGAPGWIGAQRYLDRAFHDTRILNLMKLFVSSVEVSKGWRRSPTGRSRDQLRRRRRGSVRGRAVGVTI